MSKDTKMKKRISKTRQAKMREKELKSTLKFGVKLVLILAVVIGCAQLFFYGKNVVAGRSNGPAVRIAAKKSAKQGIISRIQSKQENREMSWGRLCLILKKAGSRHRRPLRLLQNPVMGRETWCRPPRPPVMRP